MKKGNIMKKSLVILGIFGAMVCLAGCGEKKIKAEDYITLGEYRGLTVTRMDASVSDEEIEEQLASMLAQSATTEEITDRTDVQEGDVANIDYTGTLNGEVFDGGSAQGFDLQIGSGRFIPGFEEGLIGAEVGETATLNLKFPDEYPNNPDLAGQDVVFAVKVNSISEQVEPELTDAFIEEMTQGEYKSVDDYKAAMRESMEESKLEYSDNLLYSDLRERVVENATLKKDIPEEYIQSIGDRMKENVKSMASAYGMDYATYLQNYLGVDEAGLDEQIKTYAPDAAKEALVIKAIAKAEGITISKDELNDAVKEAVELYGYESESDFKENTDMDYYEESLLNTKVEKFLAENAVVAIDEEQQAQ